MTDAVRRRAERRKHELEVSPCAFCGKACEPWAGNPGKWPVLLPSPDGAGALKAHHVSCVMERLSVAARADTGGERERIRAVIGAYRKLRSVSLLPHDVAGQRMVLEADKVVEDYCLSLTTPAATQPTPAAD